MEKIRKLFGNTKMTWPRVLLLAVITAVYTALVNELRFLRDTSFQDIAIGPECWILFAVFLVVNCEKWWDAALKCFVFFLVSQPLIYLLEVPFEPLGWGVFSYYGYWFRITLLTLPGGAAAFWVKKKNLLSVLILSAATSFLAYMGVTYLKSVIWNPPFHILSAIFCFALSLFFIFLFTDGKKLRALALAIFAAAIIVSVFVTDLFGKSTGSIDLAEGEWKCSIDDSRIVSVSFRDDEALITPKHNGSTVITFTDGSGAVREYYISVTNGTIWIDEMAKE